MRPRHDHAQDRGRIGIEAAHDDYPILLALLDQEFFRALKLE